MRLSIERGESVSECKARVSERDFRTYWLYSQREPSVGERLDWWMAHLVAAVLAPYRKSGQPALSAERLIPKRWPQSRPSEAALIQKIKDWSARHNGE